MSEKELQMEIRKYFILKYPDYSDCFQLNLLSDFRIVPLLPKKWQSLEGKIEETVDKIEIFYNKDMPGSLVKTAKDETRHLLGKLLEEYTSVRVQVPHLWRQVHRIFSFMGVEKGSPDIRIFKQTPKYKSLCLEVKRDGVIVFKKNGELTKNKHIQKQYNKLMELRQKGNKAVFGVGYQECINIIDEYMSEC